jgi:hypothetical protein
LLALVIAHSPSIFDGDSVDLSALIFDSCAA